MTRQQKQQQQVAPSVDYQALFEAAPGLFLVLLPDKHYTIVAVSNAYLHATSTKRKDIVGRGLFTIFPDNPDDPKATGTANLRASLEQAIKQKSADTMAVQKYDIPRPKEDGGGFEVRYWSPLNTPVLNSKGEVIYIIHRVEDVTDYMKLKKHGAKQIKLAEELKSKAGEMEVEIYRRAQELQAVNKRLLEANDKLSELDGLKTHFFTSVSHEFRTPLTLILGPLEQVLAEQSLPKETRQQLELIKRNALRLQKLVNNLLEFSSLEAGKLQAVFQPTDIARQTRELASSFQSAMDSANLKLIIKCPPLPRNVYVDPQHWETIVLNLLSNALKFTLQGSVKVSLRQTASSVVLTIADSGAGIPPEEIPRLFERFHQVKGANARSGEGSGIGLALVHELVQLHGGHVTVRSQPGKGSSFSVHIPLGSKHLPDKQVYESNLKAAPATPRHAYIDEALGWQRQSAASQNKPVDSSGVGSAEKARVLVVDDNADMRQYIHRVLAADTELEIDTVTDGNSALKAIGSQMPDIILSDIMMPGMDGFELMHAIRQNPAAAHVPIIFLSARAGKYARTEGTAEGADGYLTKPFSANELIATVQTHLNLAMMRKQARVEETRILRELNDVKDEFIGVVSHQLRTPATGVKQYIGMLREGFAGELTELQAELLEHAHSSNERQLTTIEDILKVARLDAGKVEPKKAPVDLASLISDILDEQQSKIKAKQQHISLSKPKKQQLASIDSKLIRMAIENLVDNASKYTPDGKPISVRLRYSKDYAEITIKDNGIGISKQDLPKLFQKFSRLTTGQATGADGSGIGLYWVKKVVDLHDGTIGVTSKPGKGSAFAIELPLKSD
jgi:signal transduction histidine kinase